MTDENKHAEQESVFEPDEAKIDANIPDDALQILSLDYTPEEEKKLVRKLDLNIVTYVSALYLLSYLDRANIGNAKTAGMAKDLHLTADQYDWFLTIFYISYIVFQWLTLLWKVFPPRYYVPCVVISWGLLSTCSGAVQSWGGLMAIRFLMGVAEAGYGPGVPYYLTFFYYRHEIAWRTGIFMACAPLASAFAGALAYGITEHKHALASWRLLFIVEGFPTILVGIIGFFVICNGPTQCYFLTEREKQIAACRTAKQIGHAEHDHKLDWNEIVGSMIDIKNWIPMIMFFSINVSFSALPVFLPSILEGMGYESIKAQGLSAPPYVFSFLLCLLVTWASDKTMQRGIFIIGLASMGAAGFLILAVCHVTGVKYFATYLAAGGIFPCVPLLLTWIGNNQSSDTKRGMGFVLLQLIGQCGPLLGTRSYPATDAPYYIKGFWICFSFSVLIVVCAIALRFYLANQNKKLDEKYGKVDRYEAFLASDSVALGSHTFRYIL